MAKPNLISLPIVQVSIQVRILHSCMIALSCLECDADRTRTRRHDASPPVNANVFGGDFHSLE